MSDEKRKKGSKAPKRMCRRPRKLSELPEDDPLRNLGYVVGGTILKSKKRTIH